jgi:hypothetical protein
VFDLEDLTIYESKNSNVDFFASPNSYKRIIEFSVNYLKVSDFDSAKVNYNESVNIVIGYVASIPEACVWSPEEQKKNIEKEERLARERAKRAAEKDERARLRIVLLSSIEEYEMMLKDAKTETEKKILQSTIDSLRKQLEDREKLIRAEEDWKNNRRTMKVNLERRAKNISEIFSFYCKQQLTLGRNSTFDRMNHEGNILTLGKFFLIAREFDIVGSKGINKAVS